MDVKLAYVQSNKPFLSMIFTTNPIHEFELPLDNFPELLKPTYMGMVTEKPTGYRVQKSVYRNDLKIKPKFTDASLYCKFEDGQHIRINESYVDDLPRTGSKNWQSQSDRTSEILEKAGD